MTRSLRCKTRVWHSHSTFSSSSVGYASSCPFDQNTMWVIIKNNFFKIFFAKYMLPNKIDCAMSLHKCGIQNILRKVSYHTWNTNGEFFSSSFCSVGRTAYFLYHEHIRKFLLRFKWGLDVLYCITIISLLLILS